MFKAYTEIGHPANPDVILWVHMRTRGFESRSNVNYTDNKEHGAFWRHGGYDGSGRIDTAKKIGSLVLEIDISRRAARRIIESVIEEYPGIKFRVFFYDDGTEMWEGAPVQEFWEDTE